MEAVRRAIESREPPREQGFTRPLWEESLWREHESPWADRSTIEKSLQDDGAVLWIFHEDPKPEGEVTGPRRTPYFVRLASLKCTHDGTPSLRLDRHTTIVRDSE